jgi:hypothetical protein
MQAWMHAFIHARGGQLDRGWIADGSGGILFLDPVDPGGSI